MEDIIKVGTSAGGARAKAIVSYNEKTGVIRSEQIKSKKDLLKSTKAMKLNENKAIKIINDIKSSLLKWEIFAKRAFLDIQSINSVKKMLNPIKFCNINM